MNTRIVFDHQAFTMQNYGGISRYFVKLAESLHEDNQEIKICATLHKNEYLANTNTALHKGKFFKKFPPKTAKTVDFLNRINLKRSVKKFKPDIIHETYFHHNDIKIPRKIKTVITVYDMIHEIIPESFPAYDLTSVYKKNSVFKADHIICISQSTKNDLLETYDIPSEKVSVVHLAAEKIIDNPQFTNECKNKKPFILFVGQRGGYKNFLNLLYAVSSSTQLMTDFNIITFGGGGFSQNEKNLISSLGFKENQIINISGDDHLLSSLYKSARLFIYPSMYEGFGLPLLEAMTNLCPVLSGNQSSLPEVAGNAARYFNPASIEEISEVIEEVAYSDIEIERLKVLSKVQANKFSWKKCSKETLKIYDGLL